MIDSLIFYKFGCINLVGFKNLPFMNSENEKDLGHHTENNELESLKSVYKICIETRNFEISQLIQRNNFFMLFQGVLLAAALQNQASKPFVEVIVCLAGVFVSLYQMQMASGAKFWQEWWESRVDHYEEKLRGMQIMESGHFFDLFATSSDNVYKEVSGRIRKTRKFSLTNALILQSFAVGRAPIKVSLVLLATWSLLLAHTIDFSWLSDLSVYIKGFKFKVVEQ